MKKILLVLVLSVVIMLAAVYLFIPRKLRIETTTTINAALPAVSRLLSENDTWGKFWPDTAAFKLDDQVYSIKGKFFTVFNIDIDSEKDSLGSILNLLLLPKSDVLAISWSGELISSSNPFTRIAQYRKARSIEKNMNSILNGMKNFMEQTKNIYGFDIQQTKVKDSVLITTRRSFDHHPTVIEVYDMIQSLKDYIAMNAAKEEGSPMLNIFRTDSLHFEAMTAIPIDRTLPLTDKFASKFLLKGGEILEADVTGGYYKIRAALKELENYKNDHRFNSPAIPYQLLITDRSKEPDTTKWITRLYYPIN
jgi:hypothetical protein